MAPLPVIAPPAKAIIVSPSSNQKPPKILLKTINPYITCYLCKGYLIDATTIVECLHSFCHSCLVKHLFIDAINYCPRCEIMINKAKPNIKPDATLQAIVYKLVSGLYESELMRKRLHYRDFPEKAKLATPEQRGEDTEHLIFSPTEQISLSLEYADIEELEDDFSAVLKRNIYLQCPANFTVAHLKKFVVKKFGIAMREFYVEIMYKVKTIVLPEHYTLMDVAYIYTWKRDAPMRFFYRVRSHQCKSEEVPEVPLRRISTLPIELREKLSDITELEEMKQNMLPSTQSCDNNQHTAASAANIVNQDNKVGNIQIQHNEASCSSMSSTSSSSSSTTKRHSEKTKDKKSAKKSKKDKCDPPKEVKGENIKLIIDLAKQTIKSESSSSSSSSNSIINNSGKESSPKEIIKCEKIKSETKKTETNSVIKIEDKNKKTPEKVSMSDFIKEEPKSPKQCVKLESLEISPEKEKEKSEFLESFQLTAKKSLSPVKPISPPKIPVVKTPNPLSLKITLSKRKTKGPLLKSTLKKNDASKDIIEYKIKETSPPITKLQSELNDKKFPVSYKVSPSVEVPKSKSPNKCKDNKAMLPPPPPPSPLQKSSVIPANSTLPPQLSPKAATKPQTSALATPPPPQSKPENKNTFVVNNIKRPNQVDTPRPNIKPSVKSLMKPPPIPTMRRPPQPILPKPKKDTNTFQKDMNKVLNINGAEIKKIAPADSKNKKVYGPSMDPPTTSALPPPLSYPTMHKTTNSGYLNYALMNSASKNNKVTPEIPLSKMMSGGGYGTIGTPRYQPNSPSYSPNSPQYTPNYNIPTQPQYKYMKPPVYMNNMMQNLLSRQTAGNMTSPNKSQTSPPPAMPTSTTPSKISDEVTTIPIKRERKESTSLKRPHSQSPQNSEDCSIPEKQKKVQSLLDSCNINLPSSLSITITNDKDAPTNPIFNKKAGSPVNNYIEIVKLTDSTPDAVASNDKTNISKSPNIELGKLSPKLTPPPPTMEKYPSDLNAVKKALDFKNSPKPNEIPLGPAKLSKKPTEIPIKPKKEPKKPKQTSSSANPTKRGRPPHHKNPNSATSGHTGSPPPNIPLFPKLPLPAPTPILPLPTTSSLSPPSFQQQLSELQQKALWGGADAPQSLPAYLKDAARAYAAAQNNELSLLSQFSQYQQLWRMRMQQAGSKMMENLYQQNLMNNNKTDAQQE